MTEFEREALDGRPSFVGEFLYFLATNKKWCLLPILLCLAFLAVCPGSGAALFMYTLF